MSQPNLLELEAPIKICGAFTAPPGGLQQRGGSRPGLSLRPESPAQAISTGSTPTCCGCSSTGASRRRRTTSSWGTTLTEASRAWRQSASCSRTRCGPARAPGQAGARRAGAPHACGAGWRAALRWQRHSHQVFAPALRASAACAASQLASGPRGHTAASSDVLSRRPEAARAGRAARSRARVLGAARLDAGSSGVHCGARSAAPGRRGQRGGAEPLAGGREQPARQLMERIRGCQPGAGGARCPTAGEGRANLKAWQHRGHCVGERACRSDFHMVGVAAWARTLRSAAACCWQVGV